MNANGRGVGGIYRFGYRRHQFDPGERNAHPGGGQNGLTARAPRRARSNPQPHPKKLEAAIET